MPSYEFVGPYARFYPQERNASGQSLMAGPGTVHDWASTPDDGQWLLVEDAPAEPVQERPPAVTEPAQEALEPEPAPADPEPVPEPAQAEPVSAEPQPEPVPVPGPGVSVMPPTQVSASPPVPWTFPGFAPAGQPYTR